LRKLDKASRSRVNAFARLKPRPSASCGIRRARASSRPSSKASRKCNLHHIETELSRSLRVAALSFGVTFPLSDQSVFLHFPFPLDYRSTILLKRFAWDDSHCFVERKSQMKVITRRQFGKTAAAAAAAAYAGVALPKFAFGNSTVEVEGHA